MEATHTAVPHGRTITMIVGALVFSGGFAVMAVELLGGRLLAPYFGSSIYVWGSIITVFMLALSIGYLLGGMFSLRDPSLKRFSLLFMVAAVTTLPILFGGDAIMEFVFEHFEDPRYGSLVASAMIFLLPTIALGMISPYAIRLLVEHEFHSGHVAGKLYFMSTMGSAMGTLLTSFYLVLWFEVWQIITGVIVLLGMCTMTAMLGHRWLGRARGAVA